MNRACFNIPMISILTAFVAVLVLINAPFVNAALTLSDAYPDNQEANYNPRLSVSISGYDGSLLTIIFETNNTETGEWQAIGEPQTGTNGVFTQHTNTTGFDQKNTTYSWRVNVFEDSGGRRSDQVLLYNQTYSFVAQPFVLKWTYDTGAAAEIEPLAVDVNNDGIYETFFTGEHKVTALDGLTGELLWEYNNNDLSSHAPFEIHDLNNDGIPELVVAGQARTIALNTNDGSVYWNSPYPGKNGGKHLVIVDVDGNKYPYVYIASDDVENGENGTGRIRKLRGTDGAVMVEKFVWRPCYGGLSAADANNDGKFEIYMGDRSASYDNGLGKGVQAYDADTLELLWYHDDILCSSHGPALIDVNNDGVLDVVVIDQYGSGVYVIDGSTGEKMPGKCNAESAGLPTHSQFSIWDVDEDSNIELITSNLGDAKVWDLGSWSLDATLGVSNDPPKMADVIGDGKLEIIGSNTALKIYNGTTYQNIESINIPLSRFVVQDIDDDDQNELITISYAGYVQVYDTSAYAPTPRVRTNALYYSERRLGVGVYIPPPGAPQPIIKETNIADGAVDVPLRPELSAHVIDYHYDLMNIEISTNASGAWETVFSESGVGNGWYNYSANEMDQPNTKYYWKVSAVDPKAYNPYTGAYADNISVEKTFSFITACGDGLELFTYFSDVDLDTFGDNATLQQSCMSPGSPLPEGFVFDNTDCDDSNPSIHPGAEEICDGFDNNCDGVNNEGDVCAGLTESLCNDGIDNDFDTFIDCADPDCSADPACALCGDGIKAASEDCDDNNTEDSDGCSSSCTIESGYSCSGSPSVCTLIPLCGNSVINSGEECDGSDFGGKTCSSFGFNRGTLSCTGQCAIDSSACYKHSGGGGGGGGGGGSSTTSLAESWNCGNWSDCIAGKQTQECVHATMDAEKTNTRDCTLLIPPSFSELEVPENSTQNLEYPSAEGSVPVGGGVAEESESIPSETEANPNEVTGAVTGATDSEKPVWALVTIGILIAGILAAMAFGKLKKKPVPSGRSRYMEE